jgi:hypothetical protein
MTIENGDSLFKTKLLVKGKPEYMFWLSFMSSDIYHCFSMTLHIHLS